MGYKPDGWGWRTNQITHLTKAMIMNYKEEGIKNMFEIFKRNENLELYSIAMDNLQTQSSLNLGEKLSIFSSVFRKRDYDKLLYFLKPIKHADIGDLKVAVENLSDEEPNVLFGRLIQYIYLTR